jgi:hypothetical protein
MEKGMNRDEILEELDRVREELLVAIEPLPDEALLQPGVMDDWTLADILAHLVVWESEMVTALLRIDQGKTPTRLVDAFADVDGYNAGRYKENKGRDLDRTFEDLIGVRVQLEEWLAEFSDKDLNNPKRYSWSKGLPLWHIIAENSFRHETQHLPSIKAFVAKWPAKADG